jgi:steroid 5-alpha reductase family enzyme
MARSRALGILVLAAVYGAALATGWAVADHLAGAGPEWALLAGDVAATVVVFAAAVLADNTSVYDPYWSMAPLPLALWWAWRGDPDPVRFAAVALLLGVWGVRLTGNFLAGWEGLRHEDWRYAEYRRLPGWGYWAVSLFGLHLMPTLVVFGALLPVWAITREPGRPFGLLDVAALLVAGSAIAVEAIADSQKRRFRRRHPGRVVTTGLWARSRHPNYLGEVGFWWGIFLFVPAAGGPWWTVAGPAAMTLLFVAVSIPLMDRHMADRPGYAAYAERVPALLPSLRRPGVAPDEA